MSTDSAKPQLLTESGCTVPVDEYLGDELPEGWSVSTNECADAIIQSSNTELFIRVIFDKEYPATIQLCKGPEQGTALTVYDEEFKVYEQREIREMPLPAESVIHSQKQIES